MLKLYVPKTGLRAAASCLLCALTCLSGGVARGDSVPIPSQKPAFEAVSYKTAQTPQKKPEIVRYSLKDFAKAFLNFGDASPPTPTIKPAFYESSGELEEAEVKRYRHIFALQNAGEMAQAEQEFLQLKDYRLRGHVLFQKYMHPTAYKSSFQELENWLSLYADYPGAQRIYTLAQKKKPAGYQGKLRQPVQARGLARQKEPTMVPAKTYRSGKSRSADESRAVKDFMVNFSNVLRKQGPKKALLLLQENRNAKYLDTAEYDIARAQIAAAFLYQGYPDEAFVLAAKSAKRSGINVPKAGWVAGLVAWMQRDYDTAARYFEITAQSSYASGWTQASGAYWAARAHMRTGNVREVSAWLKRAAENPRTFYGLMATRALGQDFQFNWDVPNFSGDHRQALLKTSAGRRAMALYDAGQAEMAEAELLRITPKSGAMRTALLAFAGYAQMPALALRLGGVMNAPQGQYYDAALYPTGSWQPQKGYTIDPALIHAIMRQESRFDPSAESPAGATGLMQLMPATAREISASGAGRLHDPQTNLELGQRYLSTLLKDRSVDGDLLSLLIAYNAGPGNLARWKKRWDGVEDSLLFIELISSSETRAYVERVLANYWIYRLRDDQGTPTLDALAEGAPPKYALVLPIGGSYKLASSQ